MEDAPYQPANETPTFRVRLFNGLIGYPNPVELSVNGTAAYRFSDLSHSLLLYLSFCLYLTLCCAFRPHLLTLHSIASMTMGGYSEFVTGGVKNPNDWPPYTVRLAARDAVTKQVRRDRQRETRERREETLAPSFTLS